MKIYCQDCHAYCGEIRDATLRKGLAYLCVTCSNPPIPPKENKYTDDYAINMLKNMFGMKY